MYNARIESSTGEVLLLTGNENVYQIVSIDGLNPPPAQINTTPIVGMDGGLFNSSKLETRNIVITVRINGAVEKNRLQLYRYFRTKDWCRFFYSNGSLDVYIDGYVERVECGLFSNNETAQISIICPQPYFRALAEVVSDVSHTLGLFVFPFSIELGDPIPFSDYSASRVAEVINGSQSSTGVDIRIVFASSATTITIQNVTTGETMQLVYTFQTGDIVEISTYQGHKAVTLTRSGVVSNLFTALQPGASFFQLQPGGNYFAFITDGNDEDIRITFTHADEYRGV